MADDRHAEFCGITAEPAELSELLVLIVAAHNASGGDGVRTETNSLAHIGHLYVLFKVIDAESGKLQYKWNLARIGGKAFFRDAFVHCDGVGATRHHFGNGGVDGVQPGHDAARNGVIYGKAKIVAIRIGNKAPEAHFFSEHTEKTSFHKF